MPTLLYVTPKYRKHRASGQAVVTIAGRDHYLGPYGTKASHIEYDRLVGEWLAAGRPTSQPAANEITVVELIARYVRFARAYYVRDGRPTGEAQNIKQALRLLKERYGRTPATEFGPLALKALRDAMISECDWSRPMVNSNVGRLRRMFKWAASEQLLSESAWRELGTVEGLRRGKTQARETKRVQPVADEAVDATLPKLSPVVADMVRLQRLTGMRPGELCILRPADIDRSADVWSFTPQRHKTEHHDRQRVVFIGPRAQDVLRPYLLRQESAYCFSPAESERKRRELAHARRVVPLSCGNKPGSNRNPKRSRSPRDRYTTDTYRRAVEYACHKAGIDKWHPNQLRHTAATEIRRRFGLEAAQVTLGHSKADVTQVYAERDLQKAAAVMREVG
ncbi:MAG: site-specific integrase [Pirellulales bacterium]